MRSQLRQAKEALADVHMELALEKAFLAVRIPDGRRTLALITDPAAAAATVRDDIAGANVAIRTDGTATLQ